MRDTPVEVIETLLERSLDEVDDSETSYKLRTALQLLSVIRAQDTVVKEALADCEMEEALRQRLQSLGYLDG